MPIPNQARTQDTDGVLSQRLGDAIADHQGLEGDHDVPICSCLCILGEDVRCNDGSVMSLQRRVVSRELSECTDRRAAHSIGLGSQTPGAVA